MSKTNSHWGFKPAYLLPGIFLAASCGSTPEAPEASETEGPSPELEVTTEIPSVDDLLEEQLAAMGAALADGEEQPEVADEVAQAEPEVDGQPSEVDPEGSAPEVEPEPEEPTAEEVAELFQDPDQVYLVDTVDGIPVPMGFDADFEAPFAITEAPVEVAAVDPAMEEPAEESFEETAEELIEVAPFGDEAVEVAMGEPTEELHVEEALETEPTEADEVAMAEPVEEQPTEELVEEWTEVEPFGDESVEVAQADGETVEPAADEQPEDEQPTEEPVLEQPTDAGEELARSAATDEQPVEVALLADEQPVVDLEVLPGDVVDEQPADAADATPIIELAALEGPVAEPGTEPLELFPVDPLAEETDEATEEPQPEAGEEPVLDWTPDLVEQPAEAQAADPTLESFVAEAPAEEPTFDPNLVIWLDAPTPALVLDTEHVAPGGLHAGRVVPATLAELPPRWSFMADLEPRERLLMAPMLAMDPTGGVARVVADGPSFLESTRLGFAPPEYVDPAIAALPGERRIDGSQFGPVSTEDLLVDDPGLGMIWWGTEVPFDHIDSKVDIQTPSVGRVRVVLESGDYVEGVLHAVGKGDYWVNGDLGRFAVKSSLVSHVERLPKPGLGIEIVGLQAGDLVRVKAKSGYVEGRLVSMKGDDVLVETADGMRVTLPGDDVQPLGDSDTRVVIP